MNIRVATLVAMATALVSAHADDLPKASPYHNPFGTYAAIFEVMHPPRVTVRGFDGTPAMEVRYVPSAPSFAAGPLQPALTARTLVAQTRWLQIVTVDIQAPPKLEGAGARLFGRDQPWSMTDTHAEDRKAGSPFYTPTRDGDFLDNPTFMGTENEFPVRRKSWVAELFLVRVEGTSVQPIAGLQWGFGFDELGFLIPKPPRVLTRADWETYRTELIKEYPAWSFPEH